MWKVWAGEQASYVMCSVSLLGANEQDISVGTRHSNFPQFIKNNQSSEIVNQLS